MEAAAGSSLKNSVADTVALAILPFEEAGVRALMLTVNDRPVIDWVLNALDAVPGIGETVVVLSHVTPSALGDVLVDRAEGRARSFTTARSWLEGMASALQMATPSRGVLVQGPNQPLVSPKTYHALAEAGQTNPVATAAVPVKNTYKRVVDSRAVETVPRHTLFLVQGPWIFDRAVLDEAVDRARRFQWSCTDELSLCQKAELAVRLVDGNHANLPITREAEARLVERLWQPGR